MPETITKDEINLWEVPMNEANYAIKLQACYIDLSWEYLYIYTDVEDPMSIDMDYVRAWAFVNDMFLQSLALEAVWIYGIIPAEQAFMEQNPEFADLDTGFVGLTDDETDQAMIDFRDKVEDIQPASTYFLPAPEMVASV